MGKNSFLYGTFILIIVNFIVRLLGFSYKVVLSRMIGPEAIGLFHLVNPILMILITFTSAGVPVAVSKLVAHHLSLNNKRGCNKVLALSLISGFFLSIILSVVLFFSATYISGNIIKNADIYYCLLALIPAIPLITLSSIFRGYYYGIKNVGPPGTAQVLEQLLRIIFVIGSLRMLVPLSPQLSATVAVIGISVGEFSGLLWLLIKYKYKEAIHLRKTYRIIKEGSSIILGKILYISVPITITRLIGVVVQSFNAVLIPQRLQLAGYTSQQALAIFGKLAGMAMPILFLPFIVTSALVVNIIPTVSEEMALKNYRDISLKSTLAIRITILVAVPATALFIFFADPICAFIYNQDDVGQYLSFLAYSMVFLSLYHTVSGILHGMGKQIITTINYLIGMSFQLLCTYYLVPNPNFGANGFIIGFLLSTFIICMLNIFRLHYYVKLNLNFINNIVKPIIATIFMTIVIIFVYEICSFLKLSQALNIFLSISLGIFSYAALVVLTGSINMKTLKYILKNK